jgi:hypothetical protein
MNQPVEDSLAAVLQDRASTGLRVQPALPAVEAAAFQQLVKQELAYELPAPYLAILAQTDGLDSNGIMLYASHPYFQEQKFRLQGLLEANRLLRAYAPNVEFVYFAESGMDLYRYSILGKQFEICTRVGLRVMETFGTAPEFFQRILADMLDLLTDEDEEEV